LKSQQTNGYRNILYEHILYEPCIFIKYILQHQIYNKASRPTWCPILIRLTNQLEPKWSCDLNDSPKVRGSPLHRMSSWRLLWFRSWQRHQSLETRHNMEILYKRWHQHVLSV